VTPQRRHDPLHRPLQAELRRRHVYRNGDRQGVFALPLRNLTKRFIEEVPRAAAARVRSLMADA